MRTFKIGKGEDRKFVILEVEGPRLKVTKGVADGTTRRTDKDFADEATARAACDRAARELVAHGYRERNSIESAKVIPARSGESRSKKSAQSISSGGLDLSYLEEAGEGSSEQAEAMLPRLAPTPAAEAAPRKKPGAKKKKKKRKGEGGGDELDKRVIAGIAAVGLLCAGVVGFLAYEAFLKPPTIVGSWAGSRTDHEIGKFLRNTQYSLVLDEKGRASMAVEEGTPSVGTYVLQGNRLKLSLKDSEGEPVDIQYKVSLGRATLDLFEPEGGRKIVQLIRFRDPPRVAKSSAPAEAPKDLAGGPADKAADDRLASVPFAVKDGAFSLRHPPGWAMETGARPDNMYSWARFTEGSAKIQVFADVSGSLTSGPSPTSNFEEGSELAPVHGAHERYKRTVSEMYSDYKETEPTLFKGSALGEGRVAAFTASGGMFSSKLRGMRVTLLTNDRRITILCEAPAAQFDKLKPTFLATCRSLSR